MGKWAFLSIFNIVMLSITITVTWAETKNTLQVSDSDSVSVDKQILFQAISETDIKTISRYLFSGGDINVVSDMGMTPLAMAVQTNNKQVIDYLLSKGADVSVKDSNGWGLLHLATTRSVAKLLISKGVDVHAVDQQGNTALHTTSSKTVAAYLISKGISVFSRNKKGRTPLHVATLLGNDQTVQFLLENNVDVNARDQNGRTSLFMAERKKIGNLLLDNGADISAKDSKGQTALHVVRDKQVMVSLIARGGNVNARDLEGQTPLHALGQTAGLVFQETQEIAELLLQNDANPKTKDLQGRTPLHVVDSVDIASVLLSRNTQSNQLLQIKDNEGNTPLDLAKARTNLDVTKLFADKLGLTAEDIASTEPSIQLAQPTHAIQRGKSAMTLQQKLDDAIAKKLSEEEVHHNVAIQNVVGPPKPKLVAALRIKAKFDVAGQFHKGTAPVRVGDKWGLIDTKGEWVLAPTFTEIGKYSEEGLLPVKADGKFGFINHLGTTVIDFKYDDVKPFSEGLAAVKVKGEWGYILPDGKVFLKPGFEDAGSFKEGVAPVKFEGWGYASRKWSNDKTSKFFLFDPFFQEAYEFSGGYGVIKDRNLMGLVDKNENTVIKPAYLGMKKYSEGLLAVSKKSGEWYFIDKTGKSIIEEIYKATSSFSDGLVSVKKGQKWGYIDKDNKTVIPFEYDRAYDFNDGVAVVVKDEKRLFIDKHGKVLSEGYADVYRVSEGYAPVKIDDHWGYVYIPPMSGSKAEDAKPAKTLVDYKTSTENLQ